jgi:hypothetical protein
MTDLNSKYRMHIVPAFLKVWFGNLGVGFRAVIHKNTVLNNTILLVKALCPILTNGHILEAKVFL